MFERRARAPLQWQGPPFPPLFRPLTILTAVLTPVFDRASAAAGPAVPTTFRPLFNFPLTILTAVSFCHCFTVCLTAPRPPLQRQGLPCPSVAGMNLTCICTPCFSANEIEITPPAKCVSMSVSVCLCDSVRSLFCEDFSAKSFLRSRFREAFSAKTFLRRLFCEAFSAKPFLRSLFCEAFSAKPFLPVHRFICNLSTLPTSPSVVPSARTPQPARARLVSLRHRPMAPWR